VVATAVGVADAVVASAELAVGTIATAVAAEEDDDEDSEGSGESSEPECGLGDEA
jgi:hypothetical protein